MLRVFVIRQNISKSLVPYEHDKPEELGRTFVRPLFRVVKPSLPKFKENYKLLFKILDIYWYVD